MSVAREDQLIKQSERPVTIESLVTDLTNLGLKAGDVVLVHSSMHTLGWVCGGPVAVIQALETVLGEQGTLVMPTHSGENSDPANWSNPPVPESWWQIIRDSMPAFDPFMTPTRGMGKIPETFRRQKGVVRSDHPQLSFAAWGRYAQQITSDHHLQVEMGENSPLDRIYQLNGKVMLLGVGFGNNTSFHLAEHRADYPAKKWTNTGCAMMVDGQRKWVSFQGFDYDDEDFVKIGAAFMKENSHFVKTGKVGQADALLIHQKPMVDFAVDWMNTNRFSES